MAGDFFPRRDCDLVGWSAQLLAQIIDEPDQFGVSAEILASFEAADAAFAASYRLASQPSTATGPVRTRKNADRKALHDVLRQVNAVITARPGIDAGQLARLGLNPRRRGGRQTLVQKPDAPPVVWIESVRGRTAYVTIRAAGMAGRRKRPPGVKGAAVYCAIGAQPPENPKDWRFTLETIRTRFELHFPHDLPPGTQVWIAVRWKNARFQAGPASGAITFNLPGDLPSPRPLRIAA